MIRWVRRILGSIAPKATFNDKCLRTLFAEIEIIVNSPPLSPMSFAENYERPLTPNDLLLLRLDVGVPPSLPSNFINL